MSNCVDVENSSVKNDCKSFNFEDENFLESVDEEVLYFDDTILNEEEIEEEYVLPKSSSKPLDCVSEIPGPLSSQLTLPITNLDELSFYETFIVSSNKNPQNSELISKFDNDEIGSASTLIEELEDGKILIFTTQQVLDKGERKNMEILSIITKDLKLVHEKRIKRTCSRKKSKEQSIHIIATDNNGLTLIKTAASDENVEHWRGNVEWMKEGDFLSRGANVLLMRKMVLERFCGCIQSYCCNINGDFALLQHIFHKPEQMLVTENYERVQRVDELVIFGSGKINKISSFFATATGRMLKQIASSHNYQIHINPIAELKTTFKKITENWQEDLQLMSTYFEYKAKRKEELKKKFESPCVKSALRDYIGCLIKCKPKSVMNFTLEFLKKLEQSNSVDVLKTFERRQHQQI